jgi:hypothetical protein
MNFQLIYWSILAIGVLVVLPITLMWTLVAHLRGKGSERPGSGSITSGIAGAMQELDRIMARPSIEHTVETEHPVLKREDDAGGDK